MKSNLTTVGYLVGLLLAILPCLFVVTRAQNDANPRVALANGTLIGVTMTYVETEFLRVNESIDAYLGVPYAVPPVGELRFTNPMPSVIEGEYNATYDRAECPQSTPIADLPTVGPIIGRDVGEDCLYLSIYTPSPKPTTPVPVFVWIHGGGYDIGGGSEIIYEPLPMIAMSDIIVVNINYRLGAYGYFTTGDDVAKGNYGMLDQVLALRWIHDNIAAFGGDPTMVTIGGESAGSSSVSLHTLSPLSAGLFQQTIMQSGNAMCPWAWTTMARGKLAGIELAQNAGCPTADSTAMLECLRRLPEANLTAVQELSTYDYSTPVVDGYFLPDVPLEMVNRRQMQVLPTLMGTNEDEGGSSALFVFPEYLTSEDPPVMNLSLFKTVIRVYANGYNNATDIELAAIEQEYVDWSVADNAEGDQLASFIRFDTDINFACATEHLARALEAAGADIYRYEMTHDPSWSIYAGIPQWMGASHAEDLQYVFAWGLNQHPIAQLVDQTDEEKTMSVQFMRYWTNFIKSGNPNGPLENDEGYPEWPRYTMPEQEYKKLSINMTNGRAMRARPCSFWNNFVPDLRTQTDPIEEVYEDWQDQYARWKNTDMPEWMMEFEEYKQENTCPTT